MSVLVSPQILAALDTKDAKLEVDEQEQRLRRELVVETHLEPMPGMVRPIEDPALARYRLAQGERSKNSADPRLFRGVPSC